MKRVALLLCVVAVGLSPRVAAAGPATERIEVVTSSGAHAFEVEVVRSDEDMRRGLMYRHSMAPDHGMLFDFGTPRTIMMWMKNTFIPLDMVFVGADGHVSAVAADAKPFSEAIISSGKPAVSVIEINAGAAMSAKIAPGDVVHASIFEKGR